jgi:hypothetical protein
MAWYAVGAGAVSLIGGYMQSNAAQSAADAQTQAGQAAIASQQQMLGQQQALEAPYQQGGLQALQQLLTGTAPGGQFTTPFTMADSPAQQYATKSALAGMQNQMAVGGQGLSSNAIAGAGQLAGNIGAQYQAQDYSQWLANRQQQFGQLQNIAGMGQAAASGQAANIGQAGSNISNLQTGIGNVQAAGQVGSANAVGGALNSASQYLMLQNMMNKQQTQGGGVSSYTDNPNNSSQSAMLAQLQ